MDRRDFLGAVAAAPLAGAMGGQGSASKKPGCYVMQHYELQLGTPGTRFSEYLSKVYLPAMARAQAGPTLVLEAQFSERLPLVTLVEGFASVEEAWAVRAKLRADKEFQDGTDAWQAGERPYDKLTTELLEATAFASPFAPVTPAPKAPRIYELRVYQTHTEKELRGLVERFAEAEAAILARSGSQPVVYGTTVFGQDKPNLTWMMGFEDMAARDRFTAAFNADPDWIKLRQDSLKRWGQIPKYRRLTLYRAAAYSKIL